MGLNLTKIKTRIVNSTEGFEFLGFQLISIKRSNEMYQVKIYPSRKSRVHVIKCTRHIIQKNRSASSFFVINLLNSQILGWANYFRYSDCHPIFSILDYLIFNQVRAWVLRRKSKGLKSRTALKWKYFSSRRRYHFREKEYRANWILEGKHLTKYGKLQENFLPRMTWINAAKYIKIEGTASPYDGNHLYWIKRLTKYPTFNQRFSTLMQIQYGYCTQCGVSFTSEDNIKVGPIILNSKRDLKSHNRQAFHKHCYI